MAERGRGRVLVTSSIAGTHPTPYEAVYGASETFLGSFAQALHAELDGTGVTVTSLRPGPTETDFFHRADMDDTKIGQREGRPRRGRARFDALRADEDHVVPGGQNKLLAAASRGLPDPKKAAAHAKLTEPGSG